MNLGYRILFQMVPDPRNEWIRAHYAEFEQIQGRWQRWRWTLGLLPLVGAAMVQQLRHDAATFLGGPLVKTISAALSLLNLAAGTGLLVLYLVGTRQPVVVLALSGALLIQGGFTLALMLGAARSHQEAATHLQLAGSTLALVVGTVGIAIGLLININPANNDPEYGPMAIALLIAAHAVASLLTFTPRGPARAQPSTT